MVNYVAYAYIYGLSVVGKSFRAFRTERSS